MPNEIVEPKVLVLPEEVENPEGGSHYEKYKKDGVYEYPILTNGKKDKTHVTIKYHSGTLYEGGLKHGKCHGDGKYVWKDGGYYVGKFQNGKLNGVGEFKAANGDAYTGNFQDNRYEGDGKYVWADGSCFEGSFMNGQLQSGRYTDTNGNIYFCSYTYDRKGERKNGSVKLLQAAKVEKDDNKSSDTSTQEKHEEKKERMSQKERLEKNGLLNRDATLMTAIRKSVRGAEFKNLYSGSSGKDANCEKRLMSILDFFTNSNSEQMQRIYQSSKLYDSTKGATYVEKLAASTIQSSQEYSKTLRTKGKERQNGADALKGAAR